jgi:predicted glycosyltransferase involved in capsule biosynthesis
MENIEFSIIIPWRYKPERVDLLRNMLNCLSVQDPPESKEPIVIETIIVEHIHPNEVNPTGFINVDKIITLNNNSTRFNKSWCMNVGAREAKYKHLIFVDADSMFGDDFIRTVKHGIRATPPTHNKIMFCWNYLALLPGRDNLVCRFTRPDKTRAMGGIWYAEKEFYFNQFGGMNENYEGYGGEDNDAYERACHLLGLQHISYMAYPLVHQYHHWENPDSNAIPLFEKARAHPKLVCERIINANVGKKSAPTFIRMNDL